MFAVVFGLVQHGEAAHGGRPLAGGRLRHLPAFLRAGVCATFLTGTVGPDRSFHKMSTDDGRRLVTTYGKSVSLGLPYDEAVPKVKDAFAAQGFGTLTEIDVQATLKTKIDADMERYVILGACNPILAHRALEVTRDIGLLLPCNVVVREVDRGVVVQALDPAVIASVPGLSDLEPIAAEATQRVEAALSSLAGSA